VPSYVVEAYVSSLERGKLDDAAVRAREAAVALSAEGRRIRFVRSTFLPVDEVGFLVFEADSAEVVRELAARAEITHERIVEAVEVI
jgi:hypothetical protein